jgi:5-(carboxyamino)imidazole ribonucleotide synthase
MGKTFDLGFLGGGQLARMSIQAAQRVGLTCLSLDPGGITPASQVAEALQGELGDPTAIARILSQCEFVTLENEFIPADAIRAGMKQAGRNESALVPGVDALATIQDKLLQRQALIAAGVPSPRAFAVVDGPPKELAFPMVLKARFGGYDGKGTRYARTPAEFESYRELWATGGWLAEEFVPFRRELAVMAYTDGTAFGAFPTMETVQSDHVCDHVFPCDAEGQGIAVAAVRAIGSAGLFGVELFQLNSGEILVNEMAPRPHNTGHYTLDWGGISQFEQHVRLATGLPTVAPSGNPVCMANLLGQPNAGDYRQGLQAALSHPGARFHWYGKAESRPGRKMGHLNMVAACGQSVEELVRDALVQRSRFYEAWTKP